MEVKSIFADLIVKKYEKQDPCAQARDHDNSSVKELDADSISISPQASKRLFGELMEQSLRKGLSGVCADES